MYELAQPGNPNNLYGVRSNGIRFIEEAGRGCGMGCAGVGGLTMDGSGLFGTGIFGTGVTLADLSSWGIGEWGSVLLGAFVLFSVVGTGKRAAKSVSKKVRYVRGAGRRRRSAQAEKLRSEAAQLEAA